MKVKINSYMLKKQTSISIRCTNNFNTFVFIGSIGSIIRVASVLDIYFIYNLHTFFKTSHHVQIFSVCIISNSLNSDLNTVYQSKILLKENI